MTNIAKKICALLLALILLLTVAVPSLAWFAAFISANFPTVTGSSEGAFFGDGDGSVDNPYILSAPWHLYNFAWLQYIGYFNLGQANNGRAQSYFRLGDNIDMTGIPLPPIGTTEYPFIGNFDGNGKIISNLTTANAKSLLTERPDNANFAAANELLSLFGGSTAEAGAVIGFFGVVGDYDGELSALDAMTDISLSDATPPTTESDATEQTNANTVYRKAIGIHTFGLADYTLQSSSSATTVGLVAGYVDAMVEGVMVDRCTVNTPHATEGKVTAAQVSDYMLIGHTTATASVSQNDVVLYDPTVTTETLGPGSGGTGGSPDSGFGGSLDMSELARRLTYMLGENMMRTQTSWTFTPNTYVTTKDKYPVNFSNVITRLPALYDYIHYKNLESQTYRIAFLGDGSAIPLNVNTEQMFASDDIEVTAAYSSDTRTFWTNAYYNSNTSEAVLPNNTGYIVGAGNTSGAWIRLRMQSIDGAYDGISKSLSDGGTKITYTKTGTDANGKDTYTTNLELYTVTPTGTNQKVSSTHTFKQYDDVLRRFASTQAALYADSTDAALIFGIRFYSSDRMGIEIKSDGTVANTTHVEDFTIDGVPKESETQTYEMIDGAINFTLSSDGYITAIAGTYVDNNNHALFSLYKVEREKDANGNYKISRATKIDTVYVKTDTGTEAGTVTEIQYNLTQEQAQEGGYLCVFNAANMTTLTENGCAYYFEIPVTAGQYALGAPKIQSGSNGAYLMYLDIGTDGDMSLGGSTNPTTVVSEYIEETTNTYTYASGVSVAQITETNGTYTIVQQPLGLVAAQIAAGIQQSSIAREGNTIVLSGGTLTMLGDGLTSTSGPPTPTTTVTTITRRRTYIHSDGARVVVTRTNEDNATITVTAKDSNGNDVPLTEGPTTIGGVTTFKTAQRTYTITWSDIQPTTSLLAYAYTPAAGVTVTGTPTFAVLTGNKIAYTVTVSASAATAVTVTANNAAPTMTATAVTVTAADNVTLTQAQ